MSYNSPESRRLTEEVADQLSQRLAPHSYEVTLHPRHGWINVRGVGINRGNAHGGFRCRVGREYSLLPWRRDPIDGQLLRLAERLQQHVALACKDTWPQGAVAPYLRHEDSRIVVGYQDEDGHTVFELLRLDLT